MKRSVRSVFLAGLLALVSVPAFATTINFDDGTPGLPIGAFYAGLGVTFSNGLWFPPIPNQAGTPSSGNFLVDVTDNGGNPPFTPTVTTPIVAIFSSSISSVSILAFDIGAAGALLVAFDSPVGGSALGFAQFFGTGDGVGTFATLSVTAPGIRRIELFQPIQVSGDGIGWDNLTFEGPAAAVPEPTTLVLLGSGAALAAFRRRRATK